MRNIFLGVLALIFALTLVWGAASVQATETLPAIEIEAVTTASLTADATGDAGGMEAEPVLIATNPATEEKVDGVGSSDYKVEKDPTRWYLLWRGFRERISLLLTPDPLRKAEKQMQYANERLRIIEHIAEKTQDPKMQAWAEKIMLRAQDHVEKLEAQQEKWTSKEADKVEQLQQQVIIYQDKKEEVMNKLEEKLPPEQQEKFDQLREKVQKQGQKMFQNMAKDKMPDEVRAHLEAVKAKIEDQAKIQEKYKIEKQELLQAIKNGDEGAIIKLQLLWKERNEALKANQEKYQETKQQWQAQKIEKINSGVKVNTVDGEEVSLENSGLEITVQSM